LSTSVGKQVRRLHALTALRFVAAGMIVVHHSPDVNLLPTFWPHKSVLLQAVSFFFVLSGFILCYVYPRMETWEARGRFLLARFARVWPAHLASFVLLVILAHKLGRLQVESWAEALSVGAVNLSMMQSWFISPKYFFSFNAVSWSISTEFAFYLFFPFLIHRWEKTWWWKMAAALALAYGMIWLAVYWQLPDYSPMTVPRDKMIISTLVYINPLARVFEFTLGMFTAMVWKKTEARLPLGRWGGTLLELAAFALVLGNMYVTEDWAPGVKMWHWLGMPGYEWLRGGGIVCLSFAALVYVMACERGWISHALSAPLGIMLGEISFSVYLTHQIFMHEFVWKFLALQTLSRWIVYPLYWAVVLVTSHLIWTAVERPFRKAIIDLWPKKVAALDVHGTPVRAHIPDPPPPAPAAASPVKVAATLQADLERPGARRRSVFAALLNPGWRVAVADFLVIVLLATTAVLLAGRKVWLEPAPANTAAILAAAQPDTQDITFGNDFLLRGAQVVRNPNGDVVLTLVWQALHDVRLRYQVAVHLAAESDIGPPSKPRAQADYPQDPTQHWVHAGQTWVERHTIPAATVAGAAYAAIGIHSEKEGLAAIDKGRRDWNNHRLLLSLPPAASQPASRPQSRPAPESLPAAPR
jgi:peptidoglycan/LPS O-acetylase OafA/YrhL